MSIKSHIIQLAKYGFFGVVATIIHLSTAWAVIYFFGVSVFLSNLIGFVIAFGFSYIFQTLYVFATHFYLHRFVKFFVVQFSTFLFAFVSSNVITIENSYLHTLLIVAIMPIVTFTIHKFWTFKEI